MRSFYEYIEMVRPPLEEAFTRALDHSLGNIPMNHTEAVLKGLTAGKKIRGLLTCIICESLGGALESAIPRATAVELIHAATLVHDDFVDQDRIRRNLPAVWTVEGARRAVLIGDVIFATAIENMSALGRDDGLTVSKAISEISKGALHEPLDSRALASEIGAGRRIGELYDDIIRLKTGILFGTACSLGAIAAHTNNEIREACHRYGVLIGEAYQIADDLQDVQKYLSGELIRPEQIAMLTPALLHFSKHKHSAIVDILNAESSVLTSSARQMFMESAELMEREIGSRLKAAANEINDSFTTPDYGELLRAVPGQIIKMFNGA